MSARDKILGRLRAHMPAEAMMPPVLEAHYAPRARGESKAERLRRFRTGIEGFQAQVHLTTEDDWPTLLSALCAQKQVHTLMFGGLTPAGRRLMTTRFETTVLRSWEGQVETLKADLFHRVDAALTHARGAIAETGSLILWSSPEEPRTLSLVPPLHFVLLDAATIHPTFFDALRYENWAAGLPTNALLVSGPSKTADIQQTLAYGAHGPKELIVLVINAEGEAS
ncbi:lactate utilization protein [Zoogloea sp.]|uniref:LutC/YkgG family protein n=1 Tax=Zoogloea sp. TaxID=49181 RepID=UPI00261A175D|nr:lactate utilization protein [Zoogloea sp.]MDD3355227.1 lactate utilization protein [Zoogloea sp.]